MNKILFSGLMVLSISSVFAESEQSKGLYIYPHYTNYEYDNLLGTSINNDNGPGIALGTEMDDNWRVEISWDNIKAVTTSAISVDTTLLQINSVYTFDTDNRWQPFILAGIGNISNKFAVNPAYTADGSSFNLGFGLRYDINATFGFRTDIRTVHTFDHATNDVLFTLGFNINFAGSSSSAN